jgi:hypothetical protein
MNKAGIIKILVKKCGVDLELASSFISEEWSDNIEFVKVKRHNLYPNKFMIVFIGYSSKRLSYRILDTDSTDLHSLPIYDYVTKECTDFFA